MRAVLAATEGAPGRRLGPAGGSRDAGETGAGAFRQLRIAVGAQPWKAPLRGLRTELALRSPDGDRQGRGCCSCFSLSGRSRQSRAPAVSYACAANSLRFLVAGSVGRR